MEVGVGRRQVDLLDKFDDAVLPGAWAGSATCTMAPTAPRGVGVVVVELPPVSFVSWVMHSILVLPGMLIAGTHFRVKSNAIIKVLRHPSRRLFRSFTAC
jgi:hypothetical protein